MGNSTMPLIFLGVSVALNVGLDLLFVIPLGMGIMGAALATTIAQYVSGVGVLVYFIAAYPEFRLTAGICDGTAGISAVFCRCRDLPACSNR